MLIVVALGGNALLRRGEPLDVRAQRHNVSTAVDAIAQLAARHRVVVTHGNGPQVGLLALQAEAFKEATPYPLDVLGAESEGMIGYLLEQGIRGRVTDIATAALLTEVIVDRDDPAFERPSKPIGPVYDERAARRLARQHGWSVARDGGGWRRVVPSPEPRVIVQLETIRLLVGAGTLVICGGGGGIPVLAAPGGGLQGVEAVIDKDLSAALLARQLGADALLLLTDVPAVQRGFGGPYPEPIREALPSELEAQSFAEGSMGPKVRAACEFVTATGRPAAIGALEDAAAILEGRSGTLVVAHRPLLNSERAMHELALRTEQLEQDAQLTAWLARRASRPAFGPRRASSSSKRAR
jgi:carbamate kinase